MKRPTIKMALVSALSLITIMVLTLSVVSISSLAKLNSNTMEIGDYWMSRMVTVREIKGNLNLMRLAYSKELLAANADEIATEQAARATVQSALDQAVQTYETGIRTEKGRELLGKVKVELAAYHELGAKLADLRKSGKLEDAVAFFKTDMKAKSDEANARIDDMVQFVLDRSTAFVHDSEETYNSNLMISVTLAIIATVLAVGGIIFAISGIANPIRGIASSMKRLADGDSASDVPFHGRSDEIGEMATAVEVFRQNAINTARLEKEAVAARQAAEETRAAAQSRAEQEATQLRFATGSLGDGLKRLAGGDVSVQIKDAFSQEYESLRQDFNASVEQLGSTLGSVLNVVHSMDGGTREIATSAEDLSKRTEQQAASLEETAAALDQITVNVSSASQRTEEARHVAAQANESAVKSVKVVSDAELAMRRIEESSQQISNIIGVIDQIAFQTNLLALNAGVEAARAGEAGKGFAVVAQEVRELAQRSAQAAKEIKGLIENSTSEVESGVRLVLETGISLKSIGEHVITINRLMEAIATSSQEQAAGLAQVNIAVNQMDQTTQKNAAMVEESTAASASLASEAGRLRELVNHFKLDGSTGQASALRSTARAMAQPAVRPAPVRSAAPRVQAQVPLQKTGTGNWEEF